MKSSVCCQSHDWRAPSAAYGSGACCLHMNIYILHVRHDHVCSYSDTKKSSWGIFMLVNGDFWNAEWQHIVSYMITGLTEPHFENRGPSSSSPSLPMRLHSTLASANLMPWSYHTYTVRSQCRYSGLWKSSFKTILLVPYVYRQCDDA